MAKNSPKLLKKSNSKIMEHGKKAAKAVGDFFSGIDSSCILYATLFAIALNIILPLIFKHFATDDEKHPKDSSKLTLKGQFMHMMVHHNQVPFMSSLTIALIVGLSVFLGYLLNPVGNLMVLLKLKK